MRERVDVTPSGASRWPPLLTSSFGLERATADLSALVERSRLVTLVGAPGCGKTRLSLEMGTQLTDGFADGGAFIDLAPVSEPSLVASAAATALGVADQPDRSVEASVIDALATSDLLIVLDNCEHLADPVAQLVGRLLGRCPALHIVATSRSALGLRGEHVWRVAPLDLQASVELFRDRSSATAPEQKLVPASHDLVEQICLRLDGVPLAIELVAAWTRVLSFAGIFDQMERALPLLRSRRRDPDPRHATMEATVDWSYRLLQSSEQVLFEQLSVFAGGFDLAATRAVATEEDVLGDLATLIDHSLVLTEPTPDGAVRYRLLEPVRQCAAARLTARGSGDAVHRRHAEHYLGVARCSDAELRTSEPGMALARLEKADGNFRVALAWARSQPDDVGLQLSTALANSWAIRGRVDEGRRWMDEMLELGYETRDRALLASGLARASRLAWRQRDYRSTKALLEESLAIEREIDNPLGAARRLRGLAVLAMAQGDLTRAAELGEQSVQLFRSHDDPYGLSLALSFLGMTLQLDGKSEEAAACVQEALDLHRFKGNITGALYSLGSLAFAAIAAGDMPRLRSHIAEVADLLRALDGNHEDPGWLWWTGAALASGEERYKAALRLAGAAEAVAQRKGLHLHEQLRWQVLPWLARARVQLGTREADDLGAEGARMSLGELLQEALREADPDDHPPLSPRELEIIDLIALGLTNQEIARHLFISGRTVESHVYHVKTKLGLSRRAHIVAWALGRERRDEC